jgi:adenine-specific DNA-methyltransferase
MVYRTLDEMANKLELNWAGKYDGYALIRDEETGAPVQVPYDKVQPRLLVEVAQYGDETVDNILISGENLYALKTLVKSGYAGKVKLIYIDPPFNTGQAFSQYDDALEHSLWLDMMSDRIELLMDLLTPDGSLWVHCDDSEQAYLKAAMDEIFGRENFITTFIWQKVDSPNDNKVPVTPDHDYILCYSRNPNATNFKQKKDLSLLAAYRKDNETGLLYRDRLLKKNGKNSLRRDRPTMFFPITDPDGNDVYPIHDDGQEARWAMGRAGVNKAIAEGRFIWKRRGDNGQERWVPYTRETAPDEPARPYPTIWTDVLTTRQAKAHQRELLPNIIPFETPKPEQLIARIIAIASEEGDIVLDCFGGSGTTGAVALKMNRRFVMSEVGEHCDTHILPRLQKVVEGTDTGGITNEVDWQGGDGFRYYRLGKSLVEMDAETGVWCLNYTNGHLIEAVCLQEDFKLLGRGNYHGVRGRHYAHIADTIVTQDYVDALAADLAEDESLTIYCTKSKRKLTTPDAVQLKHIPRDLLKASPIKRGRQAEVATA